MRLQPGPSRLRVTPSCDNLREFPGLSSNVFTVSDRRLSESSKKTWQSGSLPRVTSDSRSPSRTGGGRSPGIGDEHLQTLQSSRVTKPELRVEDLDEGAGHACRVSPTVPV